MREGRGRVGVEPLETVEMQAGAREPGQRRGRLGVEFFQAVKLQSQARECRQGGGSVWVEGPQAVEVEGDAGKGRNRRGGVGIEVRHSVEDEGAGLETGKFPGLPRRQCRDDRRVSRRGVGRGGTEAGQNRQQDRDRGGDPYRKRPG